MSEQIVVPSLRVVDASEGIPWVVPEEPTSDGAITAALQFRVGVTDEPLVLRGITHLVEHLSLVGFESDEVDFNAFVDLTRTVFYARGSKSGLQDFFDHLGRALHGELPLDRLGIERGVLRAESQQRSPTLVEGALNHWFGAEGPGLLTFDEFALDSASHDHVRRWTAKYFTNGNCAGWCDSSEFVPSVDLRSGPPSPVEQRRLKLSNAPAYVTVPAPSLNLSVPVDRSTAANATLRHMLHRLNRRLREEDGVSYAVVGGYEPLSADVALLWAGADVLEDRASQAHRAFLQVLRQMAQEGVRQEELVRDQRDLARATGGPEATRGWLDTTCGRLLLKMEPPVDTGWVTELEQLDGSDIAAQVERLISEGLLFHPEASPPTPAFAPAEFGDPESVPTAATYRPRFAPRWSPERLVVAPAGVTYISNTGQTETVRFDSCAGVLAWSDGSRVLFDRSGSRVAIDVRDWRRSVKLVAAIDDHAPRPYVPRGDAPQRSEGWESVARRAMWKANLLRYGTIALALLIGGLIVAAFLTGRSGGFFLGALLAALFWNRREKHEGGPPSTRHGSG